jgi:transcriptional regulator with XRE-family HTH domain
MRRRVMSVWKHVHMDTQEKNVRMETFPERLAQSIAWSGLSRPEFAARAGVGTSALAKWLSGKLTPKSDQLYGLSKASGVSMEWLLTGTGPRRVGFELWRHGISMMAKIETVAEQEQNRSEGERMISLLFDPLQSLPETVDQSGQPYLSREQILAFKEEFTKADHEGKLMMLGPERTFAERWPDFLSRFERVMDRLLTSEPEASGGEE